MSDDKDAPPPEEAPAEEEEAPEEPPPPPKILLTVTVGNGSPLWDIPEGEDPAAQTASVSFAFGADEAGGSEVMPLGFEPVPEDAEEGTKPVPTNYDFTSSKTYERELAAKNDVLQEILTNPVCVTIYNCKDPKGEKVAVGTVTLDLLPLVNGAVEVGGDACPVQALPQEACAMVEAPTLDVRVTLAEPIVTPEEAQLAAILEVKVAEVIPLPETMVEAHKGCPEPPFTFTVGMPFPCGAGKERVVTVSGGALSIPEPEAPPEPAEGEDKDAEPVEPPPPPPPRVMFEAPASRMYLPADAIETIRIALEGDKNFAFPLEVARYLSNPAGDVQDALFDSYHGAGDLKLHGLLEPGQPTASVFVPLGAYVPPPVPEPPADKDEEPAEPEGPKSSLPPFEPNANAKARVVEPPPEGGEAPASSWGAAGSVITVEVTMSRPIYPPWVAPEAPALLLKDLIPERPEPQPPTVPPGQVAFHEEVRSIAAELAAEYTRLFTDALPDKHHMSTPQEQLKRKNALVFELNRKGQYLSMKTKLKQSVVAIVREKYQKSGTMRREEMEELYNEVYIHLTEEMHRALAAMTDGGADKLAEPAPPPIPDDGKLEMLATLAAEYEVTRDWKRAERFHQERTLAARNPRVWYDYGLFLMRKGPTSYGKAEECFKEACALEGESASTLLSLSALLCHNRYYEAAARYAHEAKALVPDSGMVWALLGFIYEFENKVEETRNSIYEAKRLGREASAKNLDKVQSKVYLGLSLFLLDMNLHELASKAVEFQVNLDGEDSVDLLLCGGRALAMGGAYQEAEDKYAAAAEMDPKDVRARILLGNLHFDHEAFPMAVSEYVKAQGAAAGGVALPLELYLRVGQCHEMTGNWGAAMEAYVEACWARPCCSTWLGAGIAFFKKGDFANADLALTEANVLDNRNPLVWGYLALVSLVSGREAEAAEALKWAIKEEIEDASILADLGRQYLVLGQWPAAESALRRAVALKAGPDVRADLADALWEEHDYEGCRTELMSALRAAEGAGNGVLKGRVLPKLVEVNTLLGREGEAHAYGVQFAA